MPFAFLHSNGSSGNEIKKNYRARERERKKKNEEKFLRLRTLRKVEKEARRKKNIKIRYFSSVLISL